MAFWHFLRIYFQTYKVLFANSLKLFFSISKTLFYILLIIPLGISRTIVIDYQITWIHVDNQLSIFYLVVDSKPKWSQVPLCRLIRGQIGLTATHIWRIHTSSSTSTLTIANRAITRDFSTLHAVYLLKIDFIDLILIISKMFISMMIIN